MLRNENNRIIVLILLYYVLISLLKMCMAQVDNAMAPNDNGISSGKVVDTSVLLYSHSFFSIVDIGHLGDDCQVTPVIHVLQYPGCVPKPIPSFACVGRCASYIQVKHINCLL